MPQPLRPDDHKSAHRVEPICKVLPIASSTYHAEIARQRDPDKPSPLRPRDAELRLHTRRVHDGTIKVHGVRKVWRHLQREKLAVDGCPVARCTVARLMHG